MNKADEEKQLIKHNNFDKIYKSASNKKVNLSGVLKVTTDNHTDMYDDNGNRLTYKNKDEIFDEVCLRT